MRAHPILVILVVLGQASRVLIAVRRREIIETVVEGEDGTAGAVLNLGHQ